MPLPMTQIVFSRRMPHGIRCRMVWCPSTTTVWPALLPALVTDHHIGAAREVIDNLAFSLVSPTAFQRQHMRTWRGPPAWSPLSIIGDS